MESVYQSLDIATKKKDSRKKKGMRKNTPHKRGQVRTSDHKEHKNMFKSNLKKHSTIYKHMCRFVLEEDL